MAILKLTIGIVHNKDTIMKILKKVFLNLIIKSFSTLLINFS
jgi:hypothetical protein